MGLKRFRFTIGLLFLCGVLLTSGLMMVQHASKAHAATPSKVTGRARATSRLVATNRLTPGDQGITTQVVEGPPGSDATSGNKGVASVSCPAGWTLSGGGFIVPDFNNGTGTITDVNESRASTTTNNGETIWSWIVTYRNTGGGTVYARAQAICQKPQTLQVQVISGPVTTATVAGAYAAFATCPDGTLLTGGGYNFQSGGAAGTLSVTTNRSQDGSTWGVANLWGTRSHLRLSSRVTHALLPSLTGPLAAF